MFGLKRWLINGLLNVHLRVRLMRADILSSFLLLGGRPGLLLIYRPLAPFSADLQWHLYRGATNHVCQLKRLVNAMICLSILGVPFDKFIS